MPSYGKSFGKGIGTPVQTGSLAGGLFSGLLWRMAQKLPPNERVTPKEKKQGRPRHKDDITDAQVAEARAAYEAGARPRDLAALYGIPRRRMSDILHCRTRSARAFRD